MINNLYVVYDKVAEESGPIFEAKNDGVAQRASNTMLENTPRKYEFELWSLGNIDHETTILKISKIKKIEIDWTKGEE